MIKHLLVVFVVVVGLVGYDFTKVQPGRNAGIAKQTQTNHALGVDLETARQSRDKVIALKKEINQTTEVIQQLLTRLPRRSEAGALLEQITANPGRGMRFESVIPRGINRKSVNVALTHPPVKGTVTYEELELGLELITTFRHLGKYLERLEQIPRLIEVVGLKISSPGAGKPLAVKMSVKTYIYGG